MKISVNLKYNNKKKKKKLKFKENKIQVYKVKKCVKLTVINLSLINYKMKF
jgi:hypothetical protein